MWSVETKSRFPQIGPATRARCAPRPRKGDEFCRNQSAATADARVAPVYSLEGDSHDRLPQTEKKCSAPLTASSGTPACQHFRITRDQLWGGGTNSATPQAPRMHKATRRAQKWPNPCVFDLRRRAFNTISGPNYVLKLDTAASCGPLLEHRLSLRRYAERKYRLGKDLEPICGASRPFVPHVPFPLSPAISQNQPCRLTRCHAPRHRDPPGP